MDRTKKNNSDDTQRGNSTGRSTKKARSSQRRAEHKLPLLECYSPINEEGHACKATPVIKSAERLNIVDSGASLHMIGANSRTPQKRKSIRQKTSYLDI